MKSCASALQSARGVLSVSAFLRKKEKAVKFQLKPNEGIRVEKVRIGRIPALVLKPEKPAPQPPGVLWIHGGG